MKKQFHKGRRNIRVGMNNVKLEECIGYFRQSDIWLRIFKGFKSKYASYGRFSGTVVIKNLKTEDIEELEGFFGKNFHGKKSVAISADRFEKALISSRYGDISPETVLNAYFGEVLLGKSDITVMREQKLAEIEQEYRKEFKGTPAEFVQHILAAAVKLDGNCIQGNDVKKMFSAMEKWKEDLWLCARLYNNLPYRDNSKKYLAVYAAGMTGNPHAFDHGTTAGKMLYRVIEADLEQRGINVEASELFPAYKKQKSYMLAGIMIDDISNYGMLYNVHAFKANGNLHKGIEGFFEEKDIIQLPLNIISELDRIECIDNEIYIVENPSVFAAMCGEKSCMCMNGQPRLASLMILELLARTGTHVFYSGDLDPEGLLIAQKLARFYPETFDYYHMTPEDYCECISNEIISPRRLKMLDKITDERIIPVSLEISKYKRAGYQENITYQIF